MKGKLRFTILNDLKLVLVYYSGVLTIEDLIIQVNLRNGQPLYGPTFNTIYDFRDCIFDIQVSDFEKCIEEAKLNPVYRIHKKVAILVNKPMETNLTFSFINTVSHYTSNTMEVFYGISLVLQYVGVSLKQKRHIEHELKKLREAD